MTTYHFDFRRVLSHLRQEIDTLDQDLIALLAKRQLWVEEAGRLKPKGDAQAVSVADRVAAVLKDRCGKARQAGLSPDIAEAIWRQMITAFMAHEKHVNLK